MQKVLNILEQYVEFIVLGLGALFLGAMAWYYLVQTPVTITVGGQQLRPGEIDSATASGPVTVVERQMAEARVPKVIVPDFTKDLHEKLITQEPPAMPMWVINALGADSKIQIQDRKNPALDATIVKSLPKIPAAQVALVGHGRSNVVMPPADWQPGTPLPIANLQAILNPPLAPAPVAPGRPGQPAPLVNPAGRVPVAPALPAVAVAGLPGAPAAPILADKDWVTVMYNLPMKAIGEAFSAVNIPQGQQLNLFKTCILDVELVRQEIIDGKPFGEESVVKKIEISNVPPFPNGLAEELQFIGWASSNQNQIIQPGFFQIARGDQWLPPGVAETMAANQPVMPLNQQTIDPNRKYTFEEIKAMTPQQKKAIRDAKDAAAKSKIKVTPRNTGRPGAEGLPEGDGASPEVPDLSRLQFAQAALPPDMLPEGDAALTGEDTGMGMQQQFQMAPSIFAQFPLPPAGEFDPRMAPEPTVGWVHDDTVEPGKSYRYKVRYKVKNPVFQIGNVAQPKNLSDVFALASPDSGWSEPVSIAPMTRFFVASLFNNKVSLEIFRWQNGQLHATKVNNVAPGDMIAFKDAGGIDYTTGWTLVDVTVDPGRNNRAQIIVADPSGKLARRDAESDRDDPEYQKMRSLITPPVAVR